MPIIQFIPKNARTKVCETKNDTLFGFMRQLIKQLNDSGHERTAETYNATLNSVARFTKGEDLKFDAINETWTITYEAYLRNNGVSANTSSFYMRILRATYNRATQQHLTIQQYPFRPVYTGVDKTAKRAILLKEIRRIKELNLMQDGNLEFARDLFLFSFYTRGMALVDMAHLTQDNLHDGRITYIRRKTGQKISIKWEKCMQDIINKYYQKKNRYLLPIILKEGANERAQYKSRSAWICAKLRIIGEMAHLEHPLTMYVARHSWASIARSSHVPISIISEGMGHESELTTQIYLASFNYKEVDKANRRIINLLSCK